MIYLTGSFDTILKRIGIRGREFEQDINLVNYYETLWSGYDHLGIIIHYRHPQGNRN